MKLRVHEIQDAGVFDTTVNLPADQIPLETPDRPKLAGDARVEIHAETIDDDIELSAQVFAQVQFDCARCLERFVVPIETRFDLEVSTQETFVDIQEEVRQSLLLALPVKPLCRPGCLGLCPRCGKNLNQNLCSCAVDRPETTPFGKLKNFPVKRD